MNTITARLDPETRTKLDSLAKSTERSRSWLVADAVRRYVADESWQIAAIEEGVRAADAGEFATEADARQAFAKWGIDADN